MIIGIDNTDIYILEQQHRAKNCKSTIYVKSVAVPDVIFADGGIKTIYICGSKSSYDYKPLKCKTLQNLKTALKHLSVWSILNDEPLRIRLNHRT
jgi:hypothetical protein|nr:MAG TPA: hypothetical protein [Caudoviricetes sp.]